MFEPVRPTIVLIHGAWHGPWCWDMLRRNLSGEGWTTTAPRLPSAAYAVLDRPAAGLHDDIAALSDHIDHIDGRVVLVAHSYGGMPATEVAARHREKVSQLVYIAAYLPREGESLFSIHGAPAPEDLSGTIPVPEDPIGTFYGDVDPAVAAEAVGRLVPQSIRSFGEPVDHVDDRAAPRTYLLCERDQALPVLKQEEFSTRADVVERMDSGHSPFLSRPSELAARLGRVLTQGDSLRAAGEARQKQP
jgi:pimeloyl-ACP methyl ester carboxylesterase